MGFCRWYRERAAAIRSAREKAAEVRRLAEEEKAARRRRIVDVEITLKDGFIARQQFPEEEFVCKGSFGDVVITAEDRVDYIYDDGHVHADLNGRRVQIPVGNISHITVGTPRE